MSRSHHPAASPMAAAAVPAAPTVEQKPDALPKWRVHLACPTPLAVNPAEVQAADETAAQRKFEDLNGIGNSTHPYTITRV